MSGYTKLFEQIIKSTIWQEPNDCRVLWITLLALKDKNHNVIASVPFLAKTANISIKDCQMYLKRFQEPDPYSTTKEDEGRRVRPIEGGFFIINGEKYRSMLSKEERKEQVKKAVQRYRLKKKDELGGSFDPRATMSPRPA